MCLQIDWEDVDVFDEGNPSDREDLTGWVDEEPVFEEPDFGPEPPYNEETMYNDGSDFDETPLGLAYGGYNDGEDY